MTWKIDAGLIWIFFFAEEKSPIQLCHQHFDSSSLADLCPPAIPRPIQSEITAPDKRISQGKLLRLHSVFVCFNLTDY